MPAAPPLDSLFFGIICNPTGLHGGSRAAAAGLALRPLLRLRSAILFLPGTLPQGPRDPVTYIFPFRRHAAHGAAGKRSAP